MGISCVDDMLFWSNDEAHIHELVIFLSKACDDLEQEDDAAGFLGVRIEQNESDLLKMMQEGLIDCVIEALGLDVGTINLKATPAEATLLVKDTDEEIASIVGMLL